MQDKETKLHEKKTGCAGLLLAALLVLSGCTKKEALLQLNGETSVEQPASGDFAGESVGDPGRTIDSSGVESAEETGKQTAQEPEETAEPVTTEPDLICIHVCGAVQRPGVYELQAGSRVYEAVQAAGGFAAEADQNYVNQAQELSDGIKLVIPTAEEAEAARGGEAKTQQGAEEAEQAGSKTAAAQIGIVEDTSLGESGGDEQGQGRDQTGRININTASEAQLCDIPGIGATRAAAIAAYRESHGAFQKPEDIMKVSGIMEGMYEKIKDSISVD